MVKKTGAVIPDKMFVKRQNDNPSSLIFAIHFPNLTTDPNSIGVTVTLDLKTFTDLLNRMKNINAWMCPKCGREISFTRPHELDNGYYYCPYCRWREE